MSHNLFNDFISKIIFLEQNSIRKKSFSNMNPFKIMDTKNIIEIQKAAHKLAHHIGLDHLTFVVNYSNLGSNIGGQIELDNDNVVLINISESILDFQECILATLAHEIAHKYLHVNKLVFQLNYENEIFTDLCAVYLGFGKIMLKGRYVEKTTGGYSYTQTRSQEVGYLNKSQLSFIYLTINTLHNISPVSAIWNIPPSDISYMLGLRIKYSRLFSIIKRYDRAQKKINKARLNLAHLCNLISHLPSSFANDIKIESFKLFHEVSKLEETIDRNKLADLISSLIFKRNRKLLFFAEYSDFKNKIILIKNTTNNYIHDLKQSNDYKHNFKDAKISDFECPNCIKKLRSKSEKAGIIICPFCKFKFGADTSKLKKIRTFGF